MLGVVIALTRKHTSAVPCLDRVSEEPDVSEVISCGEHPLVVTKAGSGNLGHFTDHRPDALNGHAQDTRPCAPVNLFHLNKSMTKS